MHLVASTDSDDMLDIRGANPPAGKHLDPARGMPKQPADHPHALICGLSPTAGEQSPEPEFG